MIKLILYSCMVLVICSCSISAKRISGTYMSTCTAYHESILVAKINKDNTFEYKLAQLNERVFGTWVIKKDTLFMHSKMFEYPENEMAPSKKFTSLPGYDAYIIKRKKLLGIAIGKLSLGKCALIKTAK